MRSRLVAAVLLAATLAGCESTPGSRAPADASKDDFCAAFAEVPLGLVELDLTAAQLHEWTDTLTDVGTPYQINGDARLGFELFVDFMAELSDEDIKKIADASRDAGGVPGLPGEAIFVGADADRVRMFLGRVPLLCHPEAT